MLLRTYTCMSDSRKKMPGLSLRKIPNDANEGERLLKVVCRKDSLPRRYVVGTSFQRTIRKDVK